MSQDELGNLKALLAAAGCTYLMSMPVGDDIMLNDQSTSFHHVPTVRGLSGRRPAREFDVWLHRMGIKDGAQPGQNFGPPEALR